MSLKQIEPVFFSFIVYKLQSKLLTRYGKSICCFSGKLGDIGVLFFRMYNLTPSLLSPLPHSLQTAGHILSYPPLASFLHNISTITCIRVQLLPWLQFWFKSQLLPLSWPRCRPDKRILPWWFPISDASCWHCWGEVVTCSLQPCLVLSGAAVCHAWLLPPHREATADQLGGAYVQESENRSLLKWRVQMPSRAGQLWFLSLLSCWSILKTSYLLHF